MNTAYTMEVAAPGLKKYGQDEHRQGWLSECIYFFNLF